MRGTPSGNAGGASVNCSKPLSVFSGELVWLHAGRGASAAPAGPHAR
jgi:hypothetical protein